MPDASPKPADASTGFIGTIETHITDTAKAIGDTVSGVVHRVNAAQTWSTITTELEPVFAQTLGPVVLEAEKSALSLVNPQALAGYEAAFGHLAASGLKALLARIALPVVAAAITAP